MSENAPVLTAAGAALLLSLTGCSGAPELTPSTGGDGGSSPDSSAPADGGGQDAVVDGAAPDADSLSDAGSGFEPSVLPDGGPVFPTNDAGQVLCGTAPCACSDGMDNDGDGVTDGFDPECTGPYDHDEGSFATGIPGDNKDDFQDCFFDGNSGGGADDCKIASACLLDRDSDACLDSFHGPRTLESEEMKCEQFCEPRTPNGCDCFGCCEVFTDAGEATAVLLEPTCEVEIDGDGHALVGDGCRVCEPSTICGNECGECELCLGRTLQDLPESCAPADPPDAGTPDAGEPTDPPPSYECVDGAGNPQSTCSADMPCGELEYCSLGCCLPTLI